jgi:AcrR family transcriptional regulator
MATPDTARPRRAARLGREREIVEATRRLFDDRGLQDAPIDQIARAAGINRALIYRHFSSKEELFVATVTSYLAELDARSLPFDESADPAELLRVASCVGAQVVLEPIAVGDGSPRHDPGRLARAYDRIFLHGRITPWR